MIPPPKTDPHPCHAPNCGRVTGSGLPWVRNSCKGIRALRRAPAGGFPPLLTLVPASQVWLLASPPPSTLAVPGAGRWQLIPPILQDLLPGATGSLQQSLCVVMHTRTWCPASSQPAAATSALIYLHLLLPAGAPNFQPAPWRPNSYLLCRSWDRKTTALPSQEEGLVTGPLVLAAWRHQVGLRREPRWRRREPPLHSFIGRVFSPRFSQ